MSGRAELIGKVEAMRSEVRAHEDNGAESVRVLVRAVDALTFVVIGMLEAQGEPPQLCGAVALGRVCLEPLGHQSGHRYTELAPR